MDITIKSISLGGITFSMPSDSVIEKNKEYFLEFHACLMYLNTELRFKFAIIGIEKDNDSNNVYRAIWRNLTEEQFIALKETIKVFAPVIALNQLSVSIEEMGEQHD